MGWQCGCRQSMDKGKMMKKWLFGVLGLVVVMGVAVANAQLTPEQVGDLRLKAEQGDAEAQFNLGKAYLWGRGVAQDNREGMRWYRMAAEQGLAIAQLALG